MPGGPNMTVTMHNTGALVGAFFLATWINLDPCRAKVAGSAGKGQADDSYGLWMRLHIRSHFHLCDREGFSPLIFHPRRWPHPLEAGCTGHGCHPFYSLLSIFNAHVCAMEIGFPLLVFSWTGPDSDRIVRCFPANCGWKPHRVVRKVCSVSRRGFRRWLPL